MYGIDFHADDYGASVHNSERILELIRAGSADSVSVIVNMSCYGECMKLLRESWDGFPRKPLLSAHINLIDGRMLSSGENGEIIRNSWGRLFFRRLIPGRKRNELKQFIAAETEAQLRAFTEETKDLRDENGKPIALRIDSHVHTHMIPLVFRALEETLDRTGLRERVSFIRCSTEPLFMFLFTPGVAGTVSPVSIVKNVTLHLLSHFVRNRLRRENIGTGRIFGVAMTGEMDLKRVKRLLPKMEKYARKKDAYLEVLSHPGRVLPEELSDEYGPDDRKAFLSPNRDTEYETFTEIRKAGR